MDLNKNNMLEKKVDLLTKLIYGHQDIANKKKTLKEKVVSTSSKSIKFSGVTSGINHYKSMHTKSYASSHYNSINTFKRQFVARFKTINQNNDSFEMMKNRNKWSIPNLIPSGLPSNNTQNFKTSSSEHASHPFIIYNKYRKFSSKNANNYYELKNKVYRKYNIQSPNFYPKFNQYKYNANKFRNNFSCPSKFKLNNKKHPPIKYIQPRRAIKLSKYYVNRSKKLILNNTKINLQKISKSKKAIYSLRRKDCLFYNRYGRCSRLPNCPYIHDPNHVAICTKFVRGTCRATNCPFSHHICKDKMPTCKYFLQGNCGKTDCKYSHIKLNSEAAVCQSFLNGYCKYGKKCNKRHLLNCPEYSKTGKCQDSKCRLKHHFRSKATTFIRENQEFKEFPINPLKLSKSRAQVLSEKIRRQSRTNIRDNVKPIVLCNDSHEFNITNLPQIIPVPPLTPAEDFQLRHPWFFKAPITDPKIIAESRTLRIFPKFIDDEPDN